MNPEYHPEFTAIDAASNSGKDEAKRIIDQAMDLPTLGKTRVVIVDEAHRLSQEAWDVYLAPLESHTLPCVFIFCTTDGRRIPITVRGRCSHLRFFKVGLADITSILVRIATDNSIEYDMDGMRTIARASRGRVRDAVSLLGTVRKLGKVTVELVNTYIDLTLPDSALAVLLYLARGKFTEACKELEAMALGYTSTKTIEEVFAAFGRTVFGDAEATSEEALTYQSLRTFFPRPAEVTATLIKWSATDRVPSDALPLFAHELLQHVVAPEIQHPEVTPPLPPVVTDPPPKPGTSSRKLTSEELVRALGCETLKTT